jgi:hypothetical protein
MQVGERATPSSFTESGESMARPMLGSGDGMHTAMAPPTDPSSLGEAAEWSGRRRWLVRGALAAAVALVMALMVWFDGAEQRAILGLPEAERQALYARTLQNLATVCSTSSEGLRDYCVREARLVLEFPECDRNCEALASRQLSRSLPRR